MHDRASVEGDVFLNSGTAQYLRAAQTGVLAAQARMIDGIDLTWSRSSTLFLLATKSKIIDHLLTTTLLEGASAVVLESDNKDIQVVWVWNNEL